MDIYDRQRDRNRTLDRHSDRKTTGESLFEYDAKHTHTSCARYAQNFTMGSQGFVRCTIAKVASVEGRRSAVNWEPFFFRVRDLNNCS